jgi:hypothetical protein
MREIAGAGESPLVVDPEDADALAAALGRLLGDAPLRHRMAEAGARRVRDLCDPALIVSAHVDLIGRARHGKGGARAAEWRPVAIGPGCAAALAGAGDGLVVLHEPGAGLAAIPTRLAIPAGCAVFLASRDGQVHTPVGLDREMLAVLDCGAFGAIAAPGRVLQGAAAAVGEASLGAPGGLWRLAAALARRAERSSLTPVTIENAGPCGARDAAAVSEALAHHMPDLAADAGRALRLRRATDTFEIAAARSEMRAHRAEAERLRSALSAAEARAGALGADLAAARARLAELEALLASPRHKLAERAGAAADAMGLRPAIRAVKRLAKDDEPKP